MVLTESTPTKVFTFCRRRERLDWRKLAAVDVEKVISEVDFEILQENISQVTFCDIRSEVDSNVDASFLKLFRLAQLIIEYMLHSQEQLVSSVDALENKLKLATDELEKFTNGVKKGVQKGTKPAKNDPSDRFLVVAGDVYKCKFCPKSFLNQTFLQMHLKRRHGHIVEESQPRIQQVPPTQQENQTQLLKELLELKEKFLGTEAMVKNQRESINQITKKELEIVAEREASLRREINAWQEDQLKIYRNEMGSLRNVLIEELQSVNGKLQDIQKEAQAKSNVGLLIDEDEINRELQQRQNEEMSKIQNQMQQHFKEWEKHMLNHFQLQEEHLGKKLQQISIKNSGDLVTKLQNSLEESQMEPVKPLSFADSSPVHLQSTPIKLKPQVQKTNIVNNNKTVKVKKTKSVNKKTRLSSSRESIDEMDGYRKVLIQNPNILKGMREEVELLLAEKLQKLGYSDESKGLNDDNYKATAYSQIEERKRLSKRYKGFHKIRQRLKNKMELLLKSSQKRARASLAFKKKKSKPLALPISTPSLTETGKINVVPVSEAKPSTSNSQIVTKKQISSDSDTDSISSVENEDVYRTAETEIEKPPLGTFPQPTPRAFPNKPPAVPKPRTTLAQTISGGEKVSGSIPRNTVANTKMWLEKELTFVKPGEMKPKKLLKKDNNIDDDDDDPFNPDSILNALTTKINKDGETSSNTAATSFWGSTSTSQKDQIKLPKKMDPPGLSDSISSWDSDDISELK